jgi:hypothetical protein
VDTDKESIEVIPVPGETTLITDAYLQEEHERNSRIESFISMIQNKSGITLNFIDNLRKKMDMINDPGTKKVLNTIIEEVSTNEN